MRDWVRKSLENIRVNQQYYQIPTDDNSLDPEVQEAINLALKKDDDYNNFKLRKHYDICEFSIETRKDELKDTSQQLLYDKFCKYKLSSTKESTAENSITRRTFI